MGGSGAVLGILESPGGSLGEDVVFKETRF